MKENRIYIFNDGLAAISLNVSEMINDVVDRTKRLLGLIYAGT